MFVVSDPIFPRTPVENIFSGLYGIGILFLFAALVITFDNYLYRLDQTYTTFASGGSAVLHPNLEILLSSCNISSTFYIGGFQVNAQMDETASHFAFLSHSLMIVGVIANLFLIVINDLVAKGCFFANIRHIRIRGISMPINTICANAMLVQSIAMLILIVGSQSGREFLDSYINKCTVEFAAANFTQFIERENNVQNVFGINLNLCIIAVSLNLAIYVLAFIALCIDGFSTPAKQFEDAKFFWESPPSGAPIKKELFHYTQWRNFALECLENGVDIELRPVSYVEFMEDLEAAKAEFQTWDDFERGSDYQQRSFYDEHMRDENDDDIDDNEKFDDIRDGGNQQRQRQNDRNGDGFDDDGDVYNGNQQQQQQPSSVTRGGGGAPFFPGEPEEVDIPEGFDPDDETAGDADGNFMMLDGGSGGGGDGDQLDNLPVPLRAPPKNDSYDGEFFDDADDYAFDPSAPSQQQRRGSADRPYSSQQAQSAMIRKKANETEEERKERHRMRRDMETAEERAARKERKRRIRELVSTAGGGRRQFNTNTNNNNNIINNNIVASGAESSPNASRPPYQPSSSDPFSARGGVGGGGGRMPPPAPSP